MVSAFVAYWCFSVFIVLSSYIIKDKWFGKPLTLDHMFAHEHRDNEERYLSFVAFAIGVGVGAPFLWWTAPIGVYRAYRKHNAERTA